MRRRARLLLVGPRDRLSTAISPLPSSIARRSGCCDCMRPV